MDVRLEEFELAIEGPLEAAGLPAAVLFGVVFTFLHPGRSGALQSLRSSLERVCGPASLNSGWLRTTLEFEWPRVTATLGSKKGTLAARQRLKATRVAELAATLQSMEGLHGLRLRASYQLCGAGKPRRPTPRRLTPVHGMLSPVE